MAMCVERLVWSGTLGSQSRSITPDANPQKNVQPIQVAEVHQKSPVINPSTQKSEEKKFELEDLVTFVKDGARSKAIEVERAFAEPCLLEKIRTGFTRVKNSISGIGANEKPDQPSPIGPIVEGALRVGYLKLFTLANLARAAFIVLSNACPEMMSEMSKNSGGEAFAIISVVCSAIFVGLAIKDAFAQFPSAKKLKHSIMNLFKTAENLGDIKVDGNVVANDAGKSDPLNANKKTNLAEIIDRMAKAFDKVKSKFIYLQSINLLRETFFLSANVISLVVLKLSFIVPGLEWFGIIVCALNFSANFLDIKQGYEETKEANCKIDEIEREIKNINQKMKGLGNEEENKEVRSALQEKLNHLEKELGDIKAKRWGSRMRMIKGVICATAALIGIVLLVAKKVFSISVGIIPTIVTIVTCVAVAVFIVALNRVRFRNLRPRFQEAVNKAQENSVAKLKAEMKKAARDPNGEVPSSIRILFTPDQIAMLKILASADADDELTKHIYSYIELNANRRKPKKDSLKKENVTNNMQFDVINSLA